MDHIGRLGDVIGCVTNITHLAQQEDINITQESGRSHIMKQTVKEKKGLLRAWILRDHGPGVSWWRERVMSV